MGDFNKSTKRNFVQYLDRKLHSLSKKSDTELACSVSFLRELNVPAKKSIFLYRMTVLFDLQEIYSTAKQITPTLGAFLQLESSPCTSLAICFDLLPL